MVLEADDARHAIRSLRLGPGDAFTSGDGNGAVVRCTVTRASRLLLEGRVVDRVVEDRPSPILSVLLAPPKGERLGWAVQKLTEVGTDRIVLVEASRSVRRWEGDRAPKALERLRSVAREAAKQARRRFLPTLEGPTPFPSAIEDASGEGPVIVLWEGAEDGLAGALTGPRPERLALAIGPEGGIPEGDVRRARETGAAVASLGPTILRTETAALVAAAVALARYGRLG